MRTIWKFPLGDDKNVVIKMPKDAKILCVQEQFRDGFIWAMVEQEVELQNRYFKSRLTGEEFIYSVNEIYLGTYQVDNGNYVVHVFEVIK